MGVEENNQQSKIVFRFCSQCANLLYPAEDREASELHFKCRQCSTVEDATSYCVYRNDLSGTVGETAGITQDVGSDPTVGDASSTSQNMQDPPPICTMCGEEILCIDCGEKEAEGLFLEVNEPQQASQSQKTEEDAETASDPESDEEMTDGLPESRRTSRIYTNGQRT